LWRYIVVGLAGGFLSGLFGVGGGILMAPLLVQLARLDQRRASATSLLAIIPTSLAGASAYAWRGQAAYALAAVITLGGVVGSWAGARLLRRVSVTALAWAFVALLAAAAGWSACFSPVRGAGLEFGAAAAAGAVGLGLVMGLASAFFGIGGGLVAVPALMGFFGASDLLARGTALLVMAPTAAVGTVANLRAGLAEVRGGLAAGLSATAASWGGASAAFLLAPRTSNVLFACVLIVGAVQLAWKTARARPARP
jgi:uncharacterized membrane protein YfcA